VKDFTKTFYKIYPEITEIHLTEYLVKEPSVLNSDVRKAIQPIGNYRHWTPRELPLNYLTQLERMEFNTDQ